MAEVAETGRSWLNWKLNFKKMIYLKNTNDWSIFYSMLNNMKKSSFIGLLALVFFVGFLFVYNKTPYLSNVVATDESKVDLNLTQYSKDMNTPDTLNAVVVPKSCSPDLSFSLLQSNFKVGEVVDYSLVVSNKGSVKCKNASVSVYYLNEEVFVESFPKANSGNYYWRFGDLAAGESKSVNIRVKYLGAVNTKDVGTEACLNTDKGDVCSNLVIGGQVAPSEQVLPSPVVVDSGKEYGTWVWVAPTDMTEDYKNTVINGAVANNINTIYITIDSYLNIFSLPEGPEKEAKKKAYSDALESFVRSANAKGIEVDAEAGWRDWAEPKERYKAYAIVDYIIEYNKTRSAKVRALQYDVEPYLMSNYETTKAARLNNFVGLIDETVKKMSGSNLRFSIVIPHFYDDRQKWTPSFTYNGVRDYTFNHLIKIMDTRPGSMIILMSYRNFALGENGTVEISDAEIDLASSVAKNTKVIVAQEVGDVDPGFVTFFGLSKQEYLDQLSLINQTFGNSAGFGGVSVHYIDPFLELE